MFHRSKTAEMSEQSTTTAHHVLDSTREIAAQALEHAADRMRDLRYGVADTASAAQRQMGRYADATSRYVAEQPVRAALIAASIGAALVAAIMVSRRRHDRY